MNENTTAGRGEGFIDQIRDRYPPEIADKIIAQVRRRDDHDNAENFRKLVSQARIRRFVGRRSRCRTGALHEGPWS
jgi:hypothetical protein